MNLYEQIIAIEPELEGRIILAVKQWNPNASLVNEKLIEGTWDNSLGIPLPTAQEIVTAWNGLKVQQTTKSEIQKQYDDLLKKGFTSAPLTSLQGKSLRLKISTDSAIMFNLRISQLREAITQGLMNADSAVTKVWDYDGKQVSISVKDLFSIAIPFSLAVEQVLELERKL